MKAGILALVFGYFLSQFYRSFLAVLTPVLATDIGADASDLSFASGVWFIIFAAMQIPVGWSLDKFGPRRTTVLLLAIGGGVGGIVFAMATGPGAIVFAMALFGIGASPVLMAAFFIFARTYPQAIFSTLAGAMLGLGSMGNLAATAPLAQLIDVFSWRQVMCAVAGAALIVAVAIQLFLRDPETHPEESVPKGNLLDLLFNRQLLFLFPLMLVNYAPAAGIRGLWSGPYFENVYALDQIGIGRATLMMALAMILGSFAYGPAERLLGSKKRVILTGNLLVSALCFVLWLFPDTSWMTAAILFTAIGFFGMSFPALMAHGQMFIPHHLTGRGITLLNLFGVGGVGLMQFVTSSMARSVPPEASITPEFYGSLFLVFGASVLIGCVIYIFSTENRPD